MKRNLISVIILALSIINFIMLAVIVFSVVPSAKKTDNLITQISSVLDLNLDGAASGEGEKKLALSDTAVYTMPDQQTIPIKSNDDKSHYVVVTAAISLDKTADNYKLYDVTAKEGIASYESRIQDEIGTVISQYTVDDANTKREEIKKKVTEAIKNLFGDDKDIVYDVSFKQFLVS